MSSKGINKVVLIGNLGGDPEMKYAPDGTPVAKFSMATNERFKDRNGEWQDRAEWHNIVAWKRLGEIACDYLKKGSRVFIDGKLRTSWWEDRESGVRKYRTEIIARDLVLLGGSNGSQSGENPARDERSSGIDEIEQDQFNGGDIPF
jgi:single-strand DNA-binding protein